MREANFYGAMDGASKFISGNVKVGIFITVINLLGGIIIGVTIHGEDITSAMSTYTSCTIGDGLLSQFPALLISTATGIIVTRSVSVGTFSQDITTQFGRDARIYLIGAITLALFALIPGFPWYVLIPLAGLLGFMAYRIDRSAKKKPVFAPGAKAGGGAAPKKAGEEGEMAPIAPLDPLSLELGYGLIPLVDKEKGAELLERVHRIRRESALDLGLVIPRIRIIDNMRLEPLEYCFKIRGMDVGRGKIRMGSYLCLSPGNGNIDIPGEKTRDPTFGLPAVWITSDRREEAERAGYTVIDPPSIIATHLTEIIKRHAAEIVGRQETQAILDNVQKDYPALVDEAKKSLSLGDIEKVFQGLLREQVSIRNTVAILESLADYGPAAKAMLSGVGNLAGYLTEKARQSLGRQLCLQYSDDDRVMRVLTLDPALEKAIVESKVDTAGGAIAALEPKMQRAWIAALGRQASFMAGQGWPLLVLCSEGARRLVKQSTERELPGLAVLSVPEIVSDVQVEQVGQIKIEG
jgi:flagellar biosynthesis protein FlhA